MVPVAPGVNSAMERHPPRSDPARVISNAASRCISRLMTQRTQRFVQVHNFTHPCVLFCIDRAKLTTQVATGFVRRHLFSLVCRTPLDRDFRI